MTGFIVSVFPSRNRVSSQEAFEGLELGEGKPSRPVLRGPGGRKAAWLLGSNCAGSPLAALVYRDAPCLLRRSWLIIRSTMYLASGTRLGPYKIEEPIGAGGM